MRPDAAHDLCYYTEQLAAVPYVIGNIDFQYRDEPITGRSDSETAYNGFVNVADLASALLVAAARHERAHLRGARRCGGAVRRGTQKALTGRAW